MFASIRQFETLKKWIAMLALVAVALAMLGCARAEAAGAYLDGQRELVRRAQQRLNDLGYLNGGVDGAYGPKTEAALRAYQAANALEATGHLDQATYDRLTDVNAQTATAKDVQQRLINLGYLKGTADGIIGPRSIEALTMFQRLNGLDATGRVDDDTMDLLFSSDARVMPQPIDTGSSGLAVIKLQDQLRQYGFFEGTADGSYGSDTREAVRAFQQHLIAQGHGDGLAADGVAGALTQYWLYSEDYSTWLRNVPAGAIDSEARRLELRLYALGYMDLPPRNVLDDYAISALKLFQDKCMAQPDGLADRETFDALFAADAPVADHPAPHAIGRGDSGAAVKAVEDALNAGGITLRVSTGSYDERLAASIETLYSYLQAVDDPDAELFANPNALSVEAQQALQDGLLGYRTDDMKNETEVKRIQGRLHALLYLDRIGVDGKFGRGTRNAISAFQQANGLVDTGDADEATQEALFSPTARAKPFEYRVEVSIAQQRVNVYHLEGDVYRQVKSFTCSTGTNDSTPRGVFLHGHPLNRWHHFKKFNCWAQYSFEIEDDILFHSVLYDTDSENTLRTGSLHALGNPASHGCVRLTVEDAKWLFEHCKRGQVVIVVD